MMKKIISVFIAFMMIFCCIPQTVSAEESETDMALYEENNIQPLELGIVMQAVIEEEDGWVYFSFTPKETGEYLLASNQSYWQYSLQCAVFNSAWEKLKTVTGNSLDGNFTLRYLLEAGETYYFGVRFLATNVTGSFSTVLVKADFTANSENGTVPVKPGQKAVMQVVASEDVTYQWYKKNGLYNVTMLEGENGPSLETEVKGREYYFCYVAGPSGIGEGILFYTYVDNELYVQDSETGTIYRYINIDYGESLTLNLEISAIDTEELMIKWRRPGESEAFLTDCASYTIDKVTNSENFYVDVSDQYGNHSYMNYYISVENNLRTTITINDEITDRVSVSPGDTVDIRVLVTADNMEGIKITWERINRVNSYGYSDGIIAENVDHIVTEPSESSQTFICRVTDHYGNESKSWIYVDIENHLNMVPVSNPSYADEGEMVTLSVKVTADDMTDLHYYWEEERHWGNGTVSFYPVEDCDTDTITVGPMGDTFMHYHCYATDRFGSTVQYSFWIEPAGSLPAYRLNFQELRLSLGIYRACLVFYGVNGKEIDGVWTSSDPEVAEIEINPDTQYAWIAGLKKGTTTITYISHDGINSDTCEVTVVQGMNEKELTLILGEPGKQLSVTGVDGIPSTDGYWSSFDETIATVDNGFVKPVAEGKTTIWCDFGDPNMDYDKCRVTVIKPVISYEWSEDNNNVTAMLSSESDGTLIESETVEATATVTVPAACEKAGEVIYSATFTDAHFEPQTKTVEIPALGHKEEVLPGKEATCTENGISEGKRCSVCGEIIITQEEIPVQGHDMVHYEAKAATCTEAGWEAYDTCSRCDLTTYIEIPALGHDYQDGVCIRCGDELHTDGWVQDENGIWYYYTNDMEATGWKKVGSTWYLFNDDGQMLTGWQKVGRVWYYFASSGAMQTGWQSIGGTWYYFTSSGAMVTGWQQIGGTWYYFTLGGAMVTGWQSIGGKWYFFKSSGAMAANEWCGGYWLNSDGSWTYQPKGSWKQDSTGWWFGDTSGWYAKNTTVKIDGVNYKFNASGYWVK